MFGEFVVGHVAKGPAPSKLELKAREVRAVGDSGLRVGYVAARPECQKAKTKIDCII